jgi:hypothetical protein
MPSELASRCFGLRRLARIWKRMRRHARKLVILIRNGAEDEKRSVSQSHRRARVHVSACEQARGSFVTFVTVCAQI